MQQAKVLSYPDPLCVHRGLRHRHCPWEVVGGIWTLNQLPLGCISANRAQWVCLAFPQRAAKPSNRSTASPVLAQVCHKADQDRTFISVQLCRAALRMSLLTASVVTLTPLLLVSFFASSVFSGCSSCYGSCRSSEPARIWGHFQLPLSHETKGKPATQCKSCSAQRSTEHL